ncbi:MAG: DUF2103 domain-containing protein [Euryarchaeota archaeon]|nr:DUF2103 domain-containing protein [Euryarchaeota archaeon]
MLKNKICGKHPTIIGERKGLEKLLEVAKIPYIKKVVPGQIKAKGAKGGGGVRFKVTRVDSKGNIKALLANGASVQEIFIITTASNFEQGKEIAEIILKLLEKT